MTRYRYTYLICLGLMSGALHAGVIDDFEQYSVGTFPSGFVWEDARNFVDQSTHTGDSVSVIQTQDAFGRPTQAVQINDHIGTSGGLVSRVGRAETQRMEVDVRFDQHSDGNVPNWMGAVGFYQELEGHDLNGMPQAIVWASKNGRFRLFVHNADGQATSADTYGLGNLSWELDTWYRIAIEADTLNGIFNVQITDIASGTMLRDVSRQINNWSPEFGQYNLISMNDGEYGTNPGTIANMATFDNVNYIPVPGTIGLLGMGVLTMTRRKR